MLSDKGIDLSTFVNKSLATFLDLPEDPNEKLLREKIDNSVIRLRIQYLNEIRDRIQKVEQTHLVEDIEKAKQKELMAELQKMGEKLQQTSCYGKVLEALKTLDPEAHCWDTALQEINAANGDNYTAEELWNKSIEWYRLYPAARS
jgi:hypothetical protein